jgi:SAM-dependent methyltransferase
MSSRTKLFTFACPRCHTPLEQAAADRLVCPADQLSFPWVEGVWRMLLPERQGAFAQFIQEYETVRQAEGRGSPSAAYYQALPYRDLSERMAADWQIRAASFDAFLKQLLVPFEQVVGHPLTILDLGAGNGWLSNRIAMRGHRVAAVDLTTNDFDGLGCHRYYETIFVPVQAEFDHLPFANRSVDLVLFNASLHYSTGFEKTLQESLRVLGPAGRLVILDTPFYRDQTSGEKMVRERQNQFEKKFGFPSNALDSENYLTYQRLADLAVNLDLDCQILTPFYGIGWALRPWKARLFKRREPARFHLVLFQAHSRN